MYAYNIKGTWCLYSNCRNRSEILKWDQHTYLFCRNSANRFTLVEVGDKRGDKSTAGERKRQWRWEQGRVRREEGITLLCKLMTEIDEIFSSRREVFSQ